MIATIPGSRRDVVITWIVKVTPWEFHEFEHEEEALCFARPLAATPIKRVHYLPGYPDEDRIFWYPEPWGRNDSDPCADLRRVAAEVASALRTMGAEVPENYCVPQFVRDLCRHQAARLADALGRNGDSDP